MQLTEDQQQQLRQWASEGATLGEIQKRLDEQFDITISFMETRFLLSDLEVALQEEEEPEPAESAETAAAGGAAPGPEAEGGSEGGELPGRPLGGLGSVSVTLDTIAQPGMMASGRATFSDGEAAAWYIDELGRLGLNPDTPDYRPTESDLMKFQEELGKAARKAGLA